MALQETQVRQVTTGDMSTSTPTSSFDIATPKGRAQFLSILAEKKSAFSAAEHEAYSALRDEMMLFARKGGSIDTLQKHADIFQVFLVSHDASVVRTEENPAVLPEQREENPVTPEVVNKDTLREVAVATPVSPFASMSKVRRGPDVMVSESAALSEKVEVTQVSSEDTESHVVDVEAQSPVAPKVSVEMEVPAPMSIEKMQESLAHTNDTLNAFAHGKAFQWLSDPETGYKEYMNELIAVRTLLSAPDGAEKNPSALARRVADLEEMARGVMNAVGGVDTPVVVAQKEEPLAEVPEALPENPSEERTVHEEVPALEMVSDTSSVQIPIVTDVNVAEDSQEHGVRESADISEAVSTTEEVLPEEIVAETPMTPGYLVEEVSPAVPEQDPPQEQEDAQMLFTPQVTTGLNNLLTQWLGTTGFLGFGDSGIKHPDWLVMKDLFVDEIRVEDGIIPKGLRPETFTNLSENIRAWSVKYGLYVENAETIEHFLRRVVFASMAHA